MLQLNRKYILHAMFYAMLLLSDIIPIQCNNQTATNTMPTTTTIWKNNMEHLVSTATGYVTDEPAPAQTTMLAMLYNNNGKITDISTNVTLFEKRILQLQINWQDNLDHDVTSYNVIVTTMNHSRCPDPPCSSYGIQKPTEYLLMPENPMSFVEIMECNYMYGCNYTVTVETSNALVSHSTHIAIPYCVSGICSCQIRPQPPKVSILAKIINNETINFSWSIKLIDNNERDAGKSATFEDLKHYRMQLKINEQTNPLLSWGGQLIPIHHGEFILQNLSYQLSEQTLHGQMQIPLTSQLSANVVLNVQTYVIDPYGCVGPAAVARVVVPALFVKNNDDVPKSNESAMFVAIVVVCMVLLVGILAIAMNYMRQRKRSKLKQQMQRDLQQFDIPMIDMEDNINYVDKYVEQSQVLGLADIFEVPHSTIYMGQEIGKGAFGRVFEATAVNLRRMRGSTLVAVKQLDINPTTDEIAEFLKEIEMLKGVGTHNNIVCFLGCCTIRPPYLMIMEYVGRGSLLSYLRIVREYATALKTGNVNYTTCRQASTTIASNGSLPHAATAAQHAKYIELKVDATQPSAESSVQENELRQPKPSFTETTYTIVEDEETFEYILDHRELHNFALQIANGMRFLEQQEITHRDLAARNVLIDEHKTLKISDFGLSRYGIYTNTRNCKLPLRWLSVEAIRENIYSNKSDVWAYGIVLWEIGTLGASPYTSLNNNEVIPYIMAGKRLEKPQVCTEQVYEVMLRCWLENPDDRPTFNELYNVLSPKATYVDMSTLSDDYVFPPIKNV